MPTHFKLFQVWKTPAYLTTTMVYMKTACFERNILFFFLKTGLKPPDIKKKEQEEIPCHYQFILRPMHLKTITHPLTATALPSPS